MKVNFKFFNLFAIVATCVLMISVFTSCKDDDYDNDLPGARYPLTGTWQGYDSEYNQYEVYKFNSDGSGYFTSYDKGDTPDWFDYFTDYKVSNGMLYLMLEDDVEWHEEAQIRNITSNSFQVRWHYDDPWLTFYKK